MSERRRERDDDDRRERPGRDRDDDRGRDSGRRRERDDDDRERESRRRDDDDSRSSRRGGGGYEYRQRDPDNTKQRAAGGGDYDSFVKPGVKTWKPNSGDNRIRVLPPTWKDAEHYGVDLYVHYGVGADREAYLCLHKMLGKPDPIHEERERFARDADLENEKDKEYLKELDTRKRVGIWLIDRDHEKDGVQFWAMPSSLDRDIVKCSVDKDSGEVLPIDHPEDGYDVTFEKNGAGMKTRYEGVSIARRSSPLGKQEWLEYAIEHPLPEQLVYYEYDQIAKTFGGGGAHTNKRDNDRGRDDKDSGRRRERDDDDDRRPKRDDDRGGSKRRDDDEELTWGKVHDMTAREMKNLIEDKDLDIDPKEAKDDEDLADWICEDLKIEKTSKRRRDDDGGKDDLDEKLAKMRERRRD